MEYFIYYFVVINIVSFVVYGIDKYRAKKHKWRVSEKVLIGLATVGGFVGAITGMQIFRHKTKHMKFVIGVPVITILWIVGFVLYLN